MVVGYIKYYFSKFSKKNLYDSSFKIFVTKIIINEKNDQNKFY